MLLDWAILHCVRGIYTRSSCSKNICTLVTSTGDTYTGISFARGTCTESTYTKDTYARSVYISNTCLKSAGVRVVSVRVAHINDIYTKDTYIKNAFSAMSAYIKGTSTSRIYGLIYKSSKYSIKDSRLLIKLISKMSINFYLDLQVILNKILYCCSTNWIFLIVYLLFYLAWMAFSIVLV